MSRRRQTHQSSDPLPYVQVDRAVKPKAAALAGVLKVPRQFALGALVEFWELCGDPREIERLIVSGKDEVVLTGDDVVRRFKLASDGHVVDPIDLQALGLLEQRGDAFRVRGMSRYFAPLRGRLSAREKGRAGGKASAEARLAKSGTSQPGRTMAGRSESRSTSAQAEREAAPKLARSSAEVGAEAGAEAQSEAAGNQSPKPHEPADSGQRTGEEDVRAQAPDEQAKPARPPRRPSTHEEFFDWAQHEAGKLEAGRVAEGPPKPAVLNSQVKPAADRVGRAGLERAWSAYLQDRGARAKGWPWALFVSQWERHFNAAGAGAPTAKEAPCQLL